VQPKNKSKAWTSHLPEHRSCTTHFLSRDHQFPPFTTIPWTTQTQPPRWLELPLESSIPIHFTYQERVPFFYTLFFSFLHLLIPDISGSPLNITPCSLNQVIEDRESSSCFALKFTCSFIIIIIKNSTSSIEFSQFTCYYKRVSFRSPLNVTPRSSLNPPPSSLKTWWQPNIQIHAWRNNITIFPSPGPLTTGWKSVIL
jgi:hypothetical protein